MRKHYRSELDKAHIKTTAKVAENLFEKTIGDGSQSVTAIFWMKTRGGWRESPQDLRIAHCDVTRLTDQDLERVIRGELIRPDPCADKAPDTSPALVSECVEVPAG